MKNILWLILLCTLISACQQSPRKNYYVLTPMPVMEKHQSTEITHVIGIGPIAVAEYLNRLQIVAQSDEGSLTMADNAYWAEPLEKGISRVLTLNLTQSDSSRAIVQFPWRQDNAPQFSLRLHVHSLNRSNQQAHINATWELIDNVSKIAIDQRHFIRTIPVSTGAQALAQAYSKFLAELAGEMDSALKAVRETD